MSEEQEQSMNRKECSGIHGSDDEFEILEGGSGRLNSNLTTAVLSTDDLRVHSDQDLGHHIAGGLQVQAADVMIIDKMCYESNSDEGLGTTVLYEYSSDSDEDHVSPLPKAYFDDAENLRSQKELEASLNPIPHALGSKRNKSNHARWEKNLDKGNLGNDAGKLAGISQPRLDSDVKQVQWMKSTKTVVPATIYKTAQVIETPYIPLYEFTYIKPITTPNAISDVSRQNLEYADCNSDDFADVEDNSADSPPEDREFSSNASKQKCRLNGDHAAGKLDKENQDEDKKISSKVGMERPGNESVKNKVEGNDNSFPKPSSSYVPQLESKPTETFPAATILQPSNNVRKETMNTIVEVPDLEGVTENPNTRQPPVSKTNPLKMKSSVGSKKIKCNVCNVRLGLCAISCRCGGYYCAKHRYDREHNCTFDYKSMGAEEIRRNNPQVIAEKVRKL